MDANPEFPIHFLNIYSNHNSMNLYTYLFFENTIPLLCFTFLVWYFDRWWLVLFALFMADDYQK